MRFLIIVFLTFQCYSCVNSRVFIVNKINNQIKIEYHSEYRDSIGYEIITYDSLGNPLSYLGNLKTPDMSSNFIGYYIYSYNKITHKFFSIDDGLEGFDTSNARLLEAQDFIKIENKLHIVNYSIYKFKGKREIVPFDTVKMNMAYNSYKYYKKLYRRKIK